MSRDHIIPQFILRGFTINPNAKKENQRVYFLDRKTGVVENKKIGDTFSLRDFNSKETESFLANEYESNVAKIFQRIKRGANNNDSNIILTKKEYELLIRFFVIMWRRNTIHMEKTRAMINRIEADMKALFGDNYNDIKNQKYNSIEDYFNDNYDKISKVFYDTIIQNTTDDDPTVQKTLSNYSFVIVNNKSKIHFILHNTYATLKYMISKYRLEVTETDIPFMMIYPISNTLSFYALYNVNGVDLNKESIAIPFEIWDKEDEIKKHFIDSYITETATHFVVDETNIDYIKNKLKL